MNEGLGYVYVLKCLYQRLNIYMWYYGHAVIAKLTKERKLGASTEHI